MMNTKELIELKAELLCWGLRYNKEAQEFFKKQNPHIVTKTGNVGLHIILENKFPLMVTTTHEFDKRTPYTLKGKSGLWFLLKNDLEVCEITPIKMPNWYSNKTSDGLSMSEIFLHEGTNFLHLAYQGCGYFQIKKPCRFCGTGSIWKNPKPKDIGETVEQACLENPKYQICLGGGTPLTPGKGTEYFIDCIREIRKRVKEIPIWVEMAPPDENKHIQMMIDASASSFGFNIEIWDDILRSEICPGKSQISKARYFEAFDFVTQKLGRNKVGTVLMAGLEPKESTIEGAKIMIQKGVRVCILPFKPWDGSEYASREPCNPKNLQWIGERVAKFMNDNALDPKKYHGCLNCSACTIEEDILKSKNFTELWDIIGSRIVLQKNCRKLKNTV